MGKGGWGHSYRGQQYQLYKAAKHDAEAQYAANMYAAKTGGLGLYGRQLRSARHYAKKYDRQVRRANKHAFRASKGGWGHSYRGQQHQLYKAAKHNAKAQYAANMYAAKTGGLGLYGRQLRSARHYAKKYERQVRRANKHAFRASKGGWGHSHRGQQHQLYKAAK